MDPTKIQVIRDWPTPTNLIELWNFLGLAKFYHRIVLGFSHITWPLSQVKKGGAKEKLFWLESQPKEFIEFKHRLCFSPMLTLPDLQQTFEIKTDASNLCYWGISYSTGASSGISQWNIVWHSPQVSHLWQRNVFHCVGLSTMEELHSGEGKNHPHRPLPLQFIQTQGELQNDRHKKWSTYL